MTLIKETHSDGTTRRCDARCYNAKGPTCHCLCGGRNHGVGVSKAAQNTAEMALELLGRGAQVHMDVLQGQMVRA